MDLKKIKPASERSLSTTTNASPETTSRQLTGTGNRLPPTSGPSIASLRLGKHDDHNLNLKISLDLKAPPSTGSEEIQIFMFAPSAAHLRDFTKNELANDFYSRAKIITRSAEDGTDTQQHLIEHMDAILAWLDTKANERTEDNSLRAAIRNYGASAAQAIKTRTRRIRQLILLYNSIASPVENPTRQIEEVNAEINQLRKASFQIRGLMRLEDIQQCASLQMLETYLHHLTVESISEITDDLVRVRPLDDDPTAFQTGWLQLWNSIADLKRIESQRAREWLQLDQLTQNAEMQEIHMLKISHLKTFFQSVTFVEITRKATLQRLSEPIATFGAAFAALAVSIVEVVSLSGRGGGSFSTTLGLQSLALIFLGIAFYTLRDRLKDYAKNYTLAKLSKVIPDVDMGLFMNGQKIGKVREWFAFRKTLELPEWVRQARMESCISEPEKAINEDVFEYKKLVTVEAASIKAGQAYDETLRINLERYLRFLDDRKKQLRSFDSDGNLVQFKSHRVYHFHIGIVTPGESQGSRRLDFYRVVVDKKGIDRVQHLSHVSI